MTMRTVSISFDANKLSLENLATVLHLIGLMQDMAEECEGMMMVNETMQLEEAIDRLPAAPEMPEATEAAINTPPKRRVGRPSKRSIEEAPAESAAPELTKGLAMVLDQIKAAKKALTRAEINEMFPDTKAGTVGTWLHALERRGLIVSEPNAEEVTEYKTPELADA